MARIIFAWELGGGLGHLIPFSILGQALKQQGHDCCFILRDLSNAELTLGKLDRPCLQAPIFLPKHQEPPTPATYPQMLTAIGYENPNHLLGHAKAWRNLFDTIQADILVAEHSPTALLASRGLNMRRIATAPTGFTLPPVEYPLRNLRTWENLTEDELRTSEDEVVKTINHVLRTIAAPEIASVGDLFHVDARIAFTFPELDQYQGREDCEYWGPFVSSGGSAPQWPAGDKKIFAYLKPFKTLPELLTGLHQSGHSVLIYSNAISGEIQQRFATERVHFSPEPVAIDSACEQADVVISHSGSMVSNMLLAGSPGLMLPLNLEQHITAERVAELGAGLNAPMLKPQGMLGKLKRLLEEPEFAEKAQAFAVKYRDFNSGETTDRFVALVDGFEF